MKKARKLITFILTVVMVLSMSMNVWAVDITINDDGATNSVYSAYRLLNATDGSADDDDTITKVAYTVNSKYLMILQNITGGSTDEQIIDAISKMDEDAIRTFADTVFEEIKKAGLQADAVTTNNDATTGENEGETNNVFENVLQGYYLIEESALGDDTETKSLVMLDTAGKKTVNIETKEDEPTVVKTIVDDSGNESSYDDAKIGEPIKFKIEGDLSDNYDNYKSYYYSFADTMSEGLTLNENTIKVYVVNGENKVEVTNGSPIFKVAKTSDNSFTATSNLKELDAARNDIDISDTTKIVVEYTATLNENAAIGKDGNTNQVILSYENDPYKVADGNIDTDEKPEEPSETTPSVNLVFTYKVVVNKVDKDEKPLYKAGFTLYRKSGEEWQIIKVENAAEDKATFTFTGLEAGTYRLEETEVPDGYTKASDIEFEIKPQYKTDADVLDGLQILDKNGEIIDTFTIDNAYGTAEIDITNLTGSLLPSTGGIGTTIFYIVGGALVLFAVVLLVTKKRMKDTQ